MAEFKINISNPKTGKSYQIDIKDDKASIFLGKKLGEKIKGDFLEGYADYEFKITGGSDKEGFPMRPGLPGTQRKKLLVKGGTGYKPGRKGEKKRKSFRGNTISDEIVQINISVEKSGKKDLSELKSPEEKK